MERSFQCQIVSPVYSERMTKNPFYNAVLASGYIVLIVTIISSFEGSHEPDTILVPIAMLSLFVLSAASMGYLFFYQPVMLYLNGKPEDAVDLFLKTLGIFACITLALFILVILLSVKQ